MRIFHSAITLSSIITACLIIASSLVLAEQANLPVLLDSCTSTKQWQTHNGGEFEGPKPKISLFVENNKLALSWDFSEGGVYGAALRSCALPANAEQLLTTLSSNQDANLCMRVRDQSGRTFQTERLKLTKGEERTIPIDLHGEFEQAWGGERNPSTLSVRLPVLDIASARLVKIKLVSSIFPLFR